MHKIRNYMFQAWKLISVRRSNLERETRFIVEIVAMQSTTFGAHFSPFKKLRVFFDLFTLRNIELPTPWICVPALRKLRKVPRHFGTRCATKHFHNRTVKFPSIRERS